jgi:hypothetical protein
LNKDRVTCSTKQGSEIVVTSNQQAMLCKRLLFRLAEPEDQAFHDGAPGDTCAFQGHVSAEEMLQGADQIRGLETGATDHGLL